MKRIQRTLISTLTTVGMVGQLLLGGATAQASGQKLIQEEAEGVKFKITELLFDTGGIKMGNYAIGMAANVKHYSLVYSDQLVTRAMMEEVGVGRPTWGTTIVNYKFNEADQRPMIGGSGVVLSMDQALYNGVQLEADFREGNGRLYYAIEVESEEHGTDLMVGGVDWSACDPSAEQICRPVSTKYGIIRMAQDYDYKWSVYSEVVEEETEGIDYTGWKPEPVEPVATGDAGVDGGAGEAREAENTGNATVIKRTGEQLQEQLIGSEYVLLGAAQNGAEALSGLLSQAGMTATAEVGTDAEMGAETDEAALDWQDDGYYGTLDVPTLGGETGQCCNNWMQPVLILILILLLANTVDMIWWWFRLGKGRTPAKSRK